MCPEHSHVTAKSTGERTCCRMTCSFTTIEDDGFVRVDKVEPPTGGFDMLSLEPVDRKYLTVDDDWLDLGKEPACASIKAHKKEIFTLDLNENISERAARVADVIRNTDGIGIGGPGDIATSL